MASEKKIQIIKTAAKRFARHGLSKTTLDEIARDLRMGKATIYHYFDSKSGLFFETLKWEGEQFLTAAKEIFNNEDNPIGARLLEYYSFKENIDEKFPLLYDLMLHLLKDPSHENENKILNDFLKKEEEIVNLILSSVYSGRIESMNSSLPPFVVLSSWGLVFGNKLNKISNPDIEIQTKEMIFKTLESVLN